MSRFYASIQGNRGEATRQGVASSGIHGHIRGWNIGVQVDGHVNSDDRDRFLIYVTGGSNGRRPARLLASAWINEDDETVVTVTDNAPNNGELLDLIADLTNALRVHHTGEHTLFSHREIYDRDGELLERAEEILK